MPKLIGLSILVFFLSCSSTKTNKVIRDHGDCYVANFSLKNETNDTTRIKVIKTAVFDTTARLLHGYITDSKTHFPVKNTFVKLFNMHQEIILQTNDHGEFEIFRDLNFGGWNMFFKHPDYVCLYVVAVIQTGGAWFNIKLERR